MPRLETGAIKHAPIKARSVAGYSLIELLVVILIAALLTSLAVLRFSSDNEAERADHSLDRLAASIELLCDQALLTGQVRGLRLSNEGYDFWSLVDHRWRRLPDDQPPRARAWPDDLPIEIEIEQRRLSAAGTDQPQLWCSALQPIGELQIRLGSGDARQTRRWPADVR
ncbi:MAG: prepilin-type N-terminal cleavage/methylation domain-containing protein [Pseudomonadota bacterium]